MPNLFDRLGVHLFRSQLELVALSKSIAKWTETKRGDKRETMIGYKQFFRDAFGVGDPFHYQLRLATEEPLPSLVNVPTGAGKTAAVLGAWLWRRINAPSTVGRRLIYCLPMRTLVEQTERIIKAAIANLAQGGLVEEGRFNVHVLMGGDVNEEWEWHPESERILIGTQDMLLSRALNRGYAMSRFRWPVHFGLLNNDCMWVFDEVQLMANGLATSSQLAAFRKKFGTTGNASQLWISATLNRDWLKSVDFRAEVDALEDLNLSTADRASEVLGVRLKAVKVLQKADEKCRLPKGLAELITEKHLAGTQTLIVVNTVNRAKEVYNELRETYVLKTKKSSDKKPTKNPTLEAPPQHPQIELMHSRFRPVERKAWLELFDKKPDPNGAGRIIVATQVVEAGVDISSRLLLTDLAPFSSLVQRFGRCNRNGEFEQAEIIWIDRPTTKEKLAEKAELEENDKLDIARPYEWRELETAQNLLSSLENAAPEVLEKVDYAERYQPFHVLRRRDLVDLFDTTPDLSGYDLDISRFVRGTDERDVSVAWRKLNGVRPDKKEPRPTHSELCSVSIYKFKNFLSDRIKGWTWDALAGEWGQVNAESLRAGMTVILDAAAGGYDPKLGWCGKDAKTVVPVVEDDTSEPEEAYPDEPLSFVSYVQTLHAHSRETRLALANILNALGLTDLDCFKAELLNAAQHHDWGKAHKIFQQTLHGAESANENFDPLLAKSNSHGRHKRKQFRHELASALALLETGASDLTVYLAACHHGKVRLSIRALPGEMKPTNADGTLLKEAKYARGIWDGDELPAVDLGDGLSEGRITFDLEPMLLGAGPDGSKSWLERMIALRDAEALGVFRLAYLESLIRAADVRASKFPQDVLGDQVKGASQQ